MPAFPGMPLPAPVPPAAAVIHKEPAAGAPAAPAAPAGPSPLAEDLVFDVFLGASPPPPPQGAPALPGAPVPAIPAARHPGPAPFYDGWAGAPGAGASGGARAPGGFHASSGGRHGTWSGAGYPPPRGSTIPFAFGDAAVNEVYYGGPRIEGFDLPARLTGGAALPVPFRPTGDTRFSEEFGAGGQNAIEAEIAYVPRLLRRYQKALLAHVCGSHRLLLRSHVRPGLESLTMRAYLTAVNDMHAAAGYARTEVGPAVAMISKGWTRILADSTNALPPALGALPAIAIWQNCRPSRPKNRSRVASKGSRQLSYPSWLPAARLRSWSSKSRTILRRRRAASTLRSPDSSTLRDATTPPSLCTPSRRTRPSQGTL